MAVNLRTAASVKRLTSGIERNFQRRIHGFRPIGETRHVPGAHGSCDLRYPYQKLKSLRIWPTIFPRWLHFVYKKSPTPNLRRQRQVFTGEIPQ